MGSILLVEPDPDTGARWVEALGAAGHAVLEAPDFGDAAALVRDGGIDVVVIDCYGQCAGLVELSRAIAALPDAPPILLVSSSPSAPEISARIGAATFLPKPCENEELIKVIERLAGDVRPVRVIEDEPTGRTQLS